MFGHGVGRDAGRTFSVLTQVRLLGVKKSVPLVAAKASEGLAAAALRGLVAAAAPGLGGSRGFRGLGGSCGCIGLGGSCDSRGFWWQLRLQGLLAVAAPAAEGLVAAEEGCL